MNSGGDKKFSSLSLSVMTWFRKEKRRDINNEVMSFRGYSVLVLTVIQNPNTG